jgi:pre-mRNA-splicing factor SYF1
LEENHFFEEAFTAYERGIGLFKWPVVFEIWNAYLAKFIKRYGGEKLERTRELFEQALDGVPADKARLLFLMYAGYEEEHGLGRHAMAVYKRATQAVPAAERYEVYQLYIKRAARLFGVVYTRDIYAAALEDQRLSDKDVCAMAMQFASLEAKLGEIDRARVIYAHTSQYCDPKKTKQFWQQWNDFEVKHGNEDTFREMLRIKRSVAAQCNTATNMAVFQAASEEAAAAASKGNAMAAAEAEAAQSAAKVKEAFASSFVKSGGEAPISGANTDEIALDDDDEEDEEEAAVGGTAGAGDGEEEEEEEKMEVEERSVPEEVFGGLMGAKERLAQARK